MLDVKIGDIVVCVDDTDWVYYGGEKLVYRKKYKVLDITTCKKCNKLYYNIGCKASNENAHSSCCNVDLVGKGIDWVGERRLLPYFENFKKFCQETIIDNMHKDIETLVKEKKYEEAISFIKRLENIRNEL